MEISVDRLRRTSRARVCAGFTRRRTALPRALHGVAWLSVVAVFSLGCSSLPFGAGKKEYAKLGEANEAAAEELAFGMTLQETTAIMGETEVQPPWANSREIGPQIVANPMDTLDFESPEGEHYTVRRYAIQLTGAGNCPFVRGDAELVPLIFFEEKLVGWRWAYLENVLQRRLLEKERSWSFGRFCDGAN